MFQNNFHKFVGVFPPQSPGQTHDQESGRTPGQKVETVVVSKSEYAKLRNTTLVWSWEAL